MCRIRVEEDGEMAYLIAGSIAFDQIMDFPGFFKDHIIPDKIHVINISFLIDDIKIQYGGCAPNIAYNFWLLDKKSKIVGAAGCDFDNYRKYLNEKGIDTSGIAVFDYPLRTASAYVITDRSDSQIVAFYLGAMKRAAETSIKPYIKKGESVIVAPNLPAAMVKHAREAQELEASLYFDPSFQIKDLSGHDLITSAAGSKAIFVNDYELSMLEKKTGKNLTQLLNYTDMIVVTLGEKGSKIFTKKEVVEIKAVESNRVVDPTGAGDAYRAGFITALESGFSIREAGQVASTIAVYAVESYGTQNHHFEKEDFLLRYKNFYKEELAFDKLFNYSDSINRI